MPGQLFTHYFLTEGIKATPEWRASADRSETFARFRNDLLHVFTGFSGFQNPNEAVTEQNLIRPILELLGWVDYLPQQGASRNEDIPDQLLFADRESAMRAAARNKPDNRFRDALAVQESKRFGRALDARDQDGQTKPGTPHGQILRYLSTAEIVSDNRIRWGILTNGGVWRLYDYRARPRASGYFEAELPELLEPGNEGRLRLFQLLLHRDSFTLKEGATSSFLEHALAEGKRYEEQVAQDLSGVVFESAFPKLVEALADAAGEDLPRVRQSALIFLYRLLFVLYAEDRNLLPVNDLRYDDYGLRKRVRDDIARRMADGDVYSSVASNYYDRLVNLFRIIDKGDPSIGLPPYNGGLFASDAAPLLERVRLPDATIAPIVYDLSHAQKKRGGDKRFVNYRDMSVQQLGSIYERLLEKEPVRGDDGTISIRPNPYARKDSGSFFTPQELVDLIVDRTLKPLAEERLKAFEEKAAQLKSDRRPKAHRKAELLKLDPAEAVLNLKVLDPAMGSGHFLVTAVDFLSDYIAELIEYVPAVPEWLDGGYVSPLVERVATVRREILRRAEEANWVLDEAQLTDQAIIRRMVLKRCIYGVDKNRLTVELAKVSLWLHSFTVGAPLSFLDHHLRVGDSLIGLRVTEGMADLRRLSSLFTGSAIAAAEAATDGMLLIEEMADADVTEVRESVALFEGVQETTAELRGLLDFLCGLRWLTTRKKKRERDAFEAPLKETLGQHLEDGYALLAKGPDAVAAKMSTDEKSAWTKFKRIWQEARSIADREGFLHWEVAFPGVWRSWQNVRPEGGFDAVIGNPPWDRIKLQEVEWFATRAREIALAPTAAARRAAIRQLRKRGDTLADDFDDAKARADTLSHLFRTSGHYPLLGRGDINLYSLFVERAMNLIKSSGFVGLLTPSGIYADKNAAHFFRLISTKGQVKSLFDFENKKIFFKDIHASQKFCALVFGGDRRRFDHTECAFFLHDVKKIHDKDRCFPLTPDDFSRVNPNTGTAPIFRCRRDAEITCQIYERHPVLVDRTSDNEVKAWPLKYTTMFHMTNDSDLFRTHEELEEKEGAWPIGSNRFDSTAGEWLALYEGKMVQAYDHRAKSVVVNPENLNRPARGFPATLDQHNNPAWLPSPQFWVPRNKISFPTTSYMLTFKDATAPTNARSMIAALIPFSGVGNTLPIISIDWQSASDAATLLANFNSIPFDYVARQKIQGQHLNLYIVEQLPVVPPDWFETIHFGPKTAGQIVREAVLELTYTAHDMSPFAVDMGHVDEKGQVKDPFTWNEERRIFLRSKLDAVFFHLYGIRNRDDVRYIYSTFTTVERRETKHYGRYYSRDLCLAWLNALAAGDPDAEISLQG